MKLLTHFNNSTFNELILKIDDVQFPYIYRYWFEIVK